MSLSACPVNVRWLAIVLLLPGCTQPDDGAEPAAGERTRGAEASAFESDELRHVYFGDGDCSVAADLGAGELKTLWQDPDFDPSARALYYVRVLENPTCRWSTWDAVRLGVQPPFSVAPTLKERAWTSPIWVGPVG